jgi:hypothetical protein
MVVITLRRERMLINKEDIGKIFFIDTAMKWIRGGRVIGKIVGVDNNYVYLKWMYPFYEYKIDVNTILYALEIDLVITDILDERRNEEITKREWEEMVRGLKSELCKFYYGGGEPSEVDLNKNLRLVAYFIKSKLAILHAYMEGVITKGELYIFESGEVMLLGNGEYKIYYGLPEGIKKYSKVIWERAGYKMELIGRE